MQYYQLSPDNFKQLANELLGQKKEYQNALEINSDSKILR